MRYFRFANWSQLQHYHEPMPPWAKIYAKILDPENDVYRLTDSQAGHLMRLIALACRRENTMPFHAEMIAEEIHANDPVDLQVFADLGMIQILNSRAECLAVERDRLRVVADKRGRERAGIGAARQVTSQTASQTASQKPGLRDQRSEFRDQRTDSRKEGDARARARQAPEAAPAPLDFDNGPAKTAEALRRGILQRDPKAKVPEPMTDAWWKWVETVDRMTTADGREPAEIQAAIAYLGKSPFWASRCRTPGRLRAALEAIIAEMAVKAPPPPPPPPPRDPEPEDEPVTPEELEQRAHVVRMARATAGFLAADRAAACNG